MRKTATKPVREKDRWTPITDPEQAAALQANGKYDNAKVTWEWREGQMWVLVDEHFKVWRIRRAAARETDSEVNP